MSISAAIPPQALEAESCVLGAILLANEAADDVAAIVRPEHFYRAANGAVYTAMLEVLRRGDALDPVTLREELDRRGELATVGGRERIADLMEAVPSAANATVYARMVADAASLRALVLDARKTLREVEERAGTAAELVERAEQRAMALIEARVGAADPAPIGVILEQEMRRLAAGAPAPGLLAGLVDLDDLTGGLRPGQLVVLAGRPGHGKSSLAYGIARHVATSAETGVLFVTLEVGREQVGQALLAQYTGFDAAHLAQGRLSADSRARAEFEARGLSEAPLFVDDRAHLTVPALRAAARVARARRGVGLVVIDYLQLLDGERRRGESRAEEVGRLSRALKQIAREIHAPVLALAQLNRAVEARDSHRPRLSDLRESGSIEQDADMVWLLHREACYRQDAEPTKAELIVAKNRSGPTGAVTLHWEASCLRFANARR